MATSCATSCRRSATRACPRRRSSGCSSRTRGGGSRARARRRQPPPTGPPRCLRRPERGETVSDSSNSAVMTVNGPVDPDELGITLSHEHLFLDLRPAYAIPPRSEADREFAEGPLTIEKLGRMKRDFGCVHDALLLDDPAL